MRNETTIDGVRLTRSQVERALEELNKATFQPGDLVRSKNAGYSTRTYIVLGGTVNARAAAVCGSIPERHVRVTDGSDYITFSEASLMLVSLQG